MPARHTERQKARHNNSKGTLHTLEDLKEDIDSLQTHITGLAREIRTVGTHKADDVMGYVNNYVGRRIDLLKNSGTETLEKVEGRIRSKPAQSVIIAFAAGALANYIIVRR